MNKKTEYLWALFLKILQNPLGRTCVKDQLKTMNPLTVFKKHHEMQTKSPAQMYESSKLMKAIIKMSLTTYNDTRVEFVTSFFENVRLFNEFDDQDEHMGYVTIRGLLATAMTSDKDLTGSISTCQPIGVREVKVAALKDHMFSVAALYDNRSDLEQICINSRKELKSSQHLQEALENLDDPELVSDIQDILVNRAQQQAPYDASARAPDHIWKTMSPQAQAHWRSMDHDMKKEFLKVFNKGSSNGPRPPQDPSRSLGERPGSRPGSRPGFPRKVYSHDMVNDDDA